jgi:hypothetical protein
MPSNVLDKAAYKFNYQGSDGFKWGLTDPYEDFEAEIKRAIAKGPKVAWDSDWQGCRKEIRSGRIYCNGKGELTIQASCSDDFDTEGLVSETIPWTRDWDKILAALDRAEDACEQDRQDKQQYAGFAIMRRLKRGWCYVETLVLPAGSLSEHDPVPGDNYHEWGFQGELETKLPTRVRVRALEIGREFAACERVHKPYSLGAGWRIKPW